MKWKKRFGTVVMTSWLLSFLFCMIQIRAVVDHVVFPAIDLVLAVFFFGKLGTAYFDFRKHGQFEWSGPAILFACLVFTLTAPTYIWQILGM